MQVGVRLMQVSGWLGKEAHVDGRKEGSGGWGLEFWGLSSGVWGLGLEVWGLGSGV